MTPYCRQTPKAKVCRQSAYARRLRDQLLNFFDNRCLFCGATIHLTFDLIKPEDQPASHHGKLSWSARMAFYVRQFFAENLQVLCSQCNTRKGDHYAPPPNIAAPFAYGDPF